MSVSGETSDFLLDLVNQTINESALELNIDTPTNMTDAALLRTTCSSVVVIEHDPNVNASDTPVTGCNSASESVLSENGDEDDCIFLSHISSERVFSPVSASPPMPTLACSSASGWEGMDLNFTVEVDKLSDKEALYYVPIKYLPKIPKLNKAFNRVTSVQRSQTESRIEKVANANTRIEGEQTGKSGKEILTEAESKVAKGKKQSLLKTYLMSKSVILPQTDSGSLHGTLNREGRVSKKRRFGQEKIKQIKQGTGNHGDIFMAIANSIRTLANEECPSEEDSRSATDIQSWCVEKAKAAVNAYMSAALEKV